MELWSAVEGWSISGKGVLVRMCLLLERLDAIK